MLGEGAARSGAELASPAVAVSIQAVAVTLAGVFAAPLKESLCLMSSAKVSAIAVSEAAGGRRPGRGGRCGCTSGGSRRRHGGAAVGTRRGAGGQRREQGEGEQAAHGGGGNGMPR